MPRLTNDTDFPLDAALTGAEKVVFVEGTDIKKATLNDVGEHVASRLGVYNVLDYGAVGDGVTDDTAAIQAAITAAAAASVNVVIPARTYRATLVAIPAGLTVDATGATIERHASTSAALVTIAAGGKLIGGDIDGRVGTLTGVDAEYGVMLTGVDASLSGAVVHDNFDHGVRGDADRFTVSFCEAYNNGTSPGASGTGDGFYTNTTSGGRFFACYAHGNARSGIVATTGATDTAISLCRSTTNSYNDVNIESSTRTRVTDLEAGSLTASTSTDVVVNVATLTTFYGTGCVRPTVARVRCHKDNSDGAFYLSATSPKVHDVSVVGTSTPSGNGFHVIATDSNGFVSDVLVEKGNNALVLEGIKEGSGFLATNATNVPYKVSGTAGQSRPQNIHSIRRGILTALHLRSTDSPPTANTWTAGDRVLVRDPALGSPAEWVCVTSGAPGTWQSIGYVGTKTAVTGSRGGNAALASLLTQLAAFGIITDSSTA